MTPHDEATALEMLLHELDFLTHAGAVKHLSTYIQAERATVWEDIAEILDNTFPESATMIRKQAEQEGV